MTLHEELTAAGYTHVHYAEDWVDYGNGQRVQQYNDPSVWL